MVNELLGSWILQAAGYMVINSLWLGLILAFLFWIIWKAAQGFSSNFRYLLLLSFLFLFTASNFYFFYKGALPSHKKPQQTTEQFILNQFDSDSFSPKPEGDSFTTSKTYRLANFVNQYQAQAGAIWLIGFILLNIRFLGGYYFLLRLKKKGLVPANHQLLETFNNLLQKTGIKQKVRLYESSSVNSPLTAGFWAPVILIPLGIMATVPLAQLEAILLHELYHIKNRDYLINLLQTLICTIFFYHPLVWWLSALIHEEREYRCDDATIAFSNNPLALARALTFIEEYHFTNNTGLTMSISGKKSNFSHRINRLFTPKKQVYFKIRGFLSLCIIIIFTSAFTILKVHQWQEEADTVIAQKNPVSLFPGQTEDSTRSLMSIRNIIIFVKDGNIHVKKENQALPEPLVVIDESFSSLKSIPMLKPEDIASIAFHYSDVANEGVISIQTKPYRAVRFAGFVKSSSEQRPERKSLPKEPPLHIYMINGIQASEKEYNETPYGFTLEGMGVEEALIRYGEKGKNGVVLFNKRKEG